MKHVVRNENAPSVLHVLWTGDIGGAERAVYQLIREQRRRKQRVAILFGRAEGPYADRLRDEGCEVISLGASRGFDPRMVPRARTAMQRFDVHHLHIVEPLLFLASSSVSGKARVFTQRAGIQEGEAAAKRVRRKVAGWFLRHRFHAWSGNNAYSAAALPATYGVPEATVRTTYNGIDFSLLEPAQHATEVRAGLGLTADHFVIGTTAFLKSWKRIDRLVEAVAKLDDPNVRALIVGDGPDRPRLETAVRTLGAEDRTVFAGMQEDVVDIVAAMDAFVLPSNEVEAFGNAVIEAMALGVPSAVFADSPGICEHIDDGRTGFIVKDVSHLIDRLRSLQRDPDLRRSIGTAAAESVRERYGVGAAVDRYELLYEEAIERSRTDA